jgi:hypothetical protein
MALSRSRISAPRPTNFPGALLKDDSPGQKIGGFAARMAPMNIDGQDKPRVFSRAGAVFNFFLFARFAVKNVFTKKVYSD